MAKSEMFFEVQKVNDKDRELRSIVIRTWLGEFRAVVERCGKPGRFLFLWRKPDGSAWFSRRVTAQTLDNATEMAIKAFRWCLFEFSARAATCKVLRNDERNLAESDV